MSIAATYLQDIRVEYPSDLDQFELRRSTFGLVTAVLAMTKSAKSIVSPDLIKKAKTSNGLNLDIPVMKKGVVTILNVRSCTIAGGNSNSDLIRVVWKTLRADIFMVPSQYDKNMISYKHDLSKKIADIVEAFLINVETDLDTALNANKNLVYNSTMIGAGSDYTLAGSAIQVPVAKQQFFFNDIEPINFADEFGSTSIKILASPPVMGVVNLWGNQGAGNQMNSVFQFPGKDFTYSNRITNGAGKKATGYFMPDGSVGLITRIDPDARRGSKAGDGTEWMEETLPGLPWTVGIQYKSKCSDQSLLDAGLAHLTSTLTENWQISFDFGIIMPYNSDTATKPGAIRKFEFVP